MRIAPGRSGGHGGTAWAPPSWLRDLFAACPIDGECYTSGDDGLAYCFRSGTRVEYIARHSRGDSNRASDKYTVKKRDGSLCYSFETLWHPSCENAQWSWRNSAGEVVASESGSWGQMTYAGVHCIGGGASVTCAPPTRPPATKLRGALGPFGPTTCAAGTCP